MADSPSSSSSSSSSSSPLLSSCYQECKAPCYIILALLLALTSFTTIHHNPSHPLPQTHNLSLILRSHKNFTILETLIHISPEIFFTTPQSTIFAIQDSSISNLSFPPSQFQSLFKHHTSPVFLPKTELLAKTPPFCFETLFGDKKMVLTQSDAKTGRIKINNVLVTHPDLFLEGSVVVHGVSGPFESMSCDSVNRTSWNVLEWGRIVRFLSRKGYVSFAIGLNAVLDGIMRENGDLGGVTVFVPPNAGFSSSADPFLERTVRIHVVKERLGYSELADAGVLSLKTLVKGYDVKVAVYSGKVSVNGVEIVRPDVFSSEKFVIHGISRAFDAAEELSPS